MAEKNQEDSLREIDALKNKIQALEEENAALQKRSVQKITKEVEVPPADYENLKKEVKKLEKKVKGYQQIFEMGGISNISIHIDKYKEMSKSQLLKICSEAHSMDYDRQQISEIVGLIDFLSQTQEQLSSLISTSSEGKFLVNRAFRQVDIDIQQITGKLNTKSNLINLDESKLEELHQILLRIFETIDNFFNTYSNR